MISSRIKLQLIAFVLLAVVGVVYTGAKYADLARLFKNTTYTVHLQLEDTGGIFTNAEVTYRGIDVGRVGALHPTADGADVDLKIRRSAADIPADGLRAEVKNLSVIGELYVDLTPSSEGAPYLHDGSVIRASQTRTPVAPARLLSNLNGLLTSVPAKSTSTVLDELSKTFAGGGGDMGRLLDSSSQLLRAARASLASTTKLIDDGSVVLRTQNDTSDSVKSFSHSLRLLAGQLATSDPDLNRLITTTPKLTTQLVDFLRESGPGASRLFADVLTLGRLVDRRGDALRQVLVVYPALARAAYSALPGDGTAHFGLVVNAFDPPACTHGYGSTRKRSGTDIADTPVNKRATCAEPSSSPIDVRGSQNAPRKPIPAAVPYPSSKVMRELAGAAGTGHVSTPDAILSSSGSR